MPFATPKVVPHPARESSTLISDFERPVDDRADVSQLVGETQQALRLHPSSVTLGPDGSEAVKKILGGMSSIAIGVAELRNRTDTGQGMAQKPGVYGP
jgi:hypothetical protein